MVGQESGVYASLGMRIEGASICNRLPLVRRAQEGA